MEGNTLMNRFRELALQSLRVGEDYDSIINALQSVINEMKDAKEYIKAYNEKDFAP